MLRLTTPWIYKIIYRYPYTRLCFKEKRAKLDLIQITNPNEYTFMDVSTKPTMLTYIHLKDHSVFSTKHETWCLSTCQVYSGSSRIRTGVLSTITKKLFIHMLIRFSGSATTLKIPSSGHCSYFKFKIHVEKLLCGTSVARPVGSHCAGYAYLQPNLLKRYPWGIKLPHDIPSC